MARPNDDLEQFGKLRSLLWPVHSYELKKLLPMLVIFFLLSFNYNLLRTTKEVNIVTASHGGAEVIPFIKVWVMLPGAFILTYIFTKISQTLSREHTFYAMVSIFVGYFLLFGLIFYPNREYFHPTDFANWLEFVLPPGFKGFVAMIRYWTFTWFYAMCELWGTAILLVSFWGFANEVTRVNEAKRFYALFGIGANFSGIASGRLAIFLSKHEYSQWIPYGKDQWDQSMLLILLTVFFTSMIAVIIFRWLNRVVLADPRFAIVHEARKEDGHKKKKKSSFRKDLQYLLHSPYMLSIAIIVLAFGFVINSVEVLWKDRVRALYPNSADYSIYMNQVTMLIGGISTFVALFVAGNAIRRSGWTFAANITPIILFLTSICFFGFILFPEQLSSISGVFGLTPLAVTVFFGTLQNCLSRASKYTFFDATKELAFVPLDRQTKLKGKAAIDGIVSRLGKSGASVLYSFLLVAFGSLPACAPVIATFLFAMILLWFIAVRYVGHYFQVLTNESDSSFVQEDSIVPEESSTSKS